MPINKSWHDYNESLIERCENNIALYFAVVKLQAIF